MSEVRVFANPDIEAKEPITVVGAGVIGVAAALALAESYDVTVVSPEGKPDADTDTTSMNAIGQFLPWVSPEHRAAVYGDFSQAELVGYSQAYYASFALNPAFTGVAPVRNIELVDDNDHEWPEGLAEAMSAHTYRLESGIHVPMPGIDGFTATKAYEFATYSISPRVALPFLANIAAMRGVQFEKGKFTREEIEGLDTIVVNTAGPESADLDTDSSQVNFVKGHTFVVGRERSDGSGETVDLPEEAISVEDLIVMPRPHEGTVVVGALQIDVDDPSDIEPTAVERAQIADRLTEVMHAVRETGLVSDFDPDFMYTGRSEQSRTGVRVYRANEGPTVAPDDEYSHIFHAYGLGGNGWTLAPHVAGQVVDLVKNA